MQYLVCACVSNIYFIMMMIFEYHHELFLIFLNREEFALPPLSIISIKFSLLHVKFFTVFYSFDVWLVLKLSFWKIIYFSKQIVPQLKFQLQTGNDKIKRLQSSIPKVIPKSQWTIDKPIPAVYKRYIIGLSIRPEPICHMMRQKWMIVDTRLEYFSCI